ncbi:FUN14 family-domain-containing protein [Lyophyllum atratum]|nr:FUN14 family-domain-containing protein [Lyophyllum atratum]
MSSSFATLLTRGFRAHTTTRNAIPSPSSLILQARSRFYSPSRMNIALHQAPKSCPTQRSVAPLLFTVAGITGIGLSLSKSIPRVYCDALPEATLPSALQKHPEIPPPPSSTLSMYQLSFGIVSGICAGVFIKKGAKAAAWFLGGIFVLLQYLASKSLVRVDWGRMATRFEKAFYSTEETGRKKAPTVTSLWTWIVDFLTADFQPRASFIAGLVLGLRIG